MSAPTDTKNKLFDAIVHDDLDSARSLAGQMPYELRIVAGLLQAGEGKPPPLAGLRSGYPAYIQFPTAFTCNLGCRMCSAGFQHKTSLYEDREYFLPSDLEAISPWLETAEYVQMVGIGETLDSPHIPEFLGRLRGKTSIITTSGVPLTREKVLLFIESGLHFLNLSFDGKTFLGHGGGSGKYVEKFWEKVAMAQRTKKERRSLLPNLALGIVVNGENAAQLDAMIATAWRHGIRLAALTPMQPKDAETYGKSIMADYETFKKDVHAALDKWTDAGMTIFLSQKKWKTPESLASSPCPYIDNALIFNEPGKAYCLCCGPLAMPMEPSNYRKNVFWNSFPVRYLRYLHLCSPAGNLPAACNECWLMNTQQYSKALTARFGGGGVEPEAAYSLYHAASRLKGEGRAAEAETVFNDALRRATDASLKGKIYFQLGELRLAEQKYNEALPLMHLAVRHCFDHRMAFVYLYLLMAVLEEPKTLPTRRPGSGHWRELLGFEDKTPA